MNDTDQSVDQRRPNLIAELGLVVEAVGDELHGHADVVAHMHAPGTSTLRMSILVAWADTVLGLLALQSITPRLPVTLELGVDLAAPVDGCETVHMIGRVIKVGSTVVVLAIEFADGEGARLGIGHSLFMAAPDPGMSMPTGTWALDRFSSYRGALAEPFAERAGCTRIGPGVAEMRNGRAVQNSGRMLNGGLVSLVVEEAALSADPDGRTLASMMLRYLRPVRTGPAIAQADLHAGLGTVQVHDAGTDALAIVATTRCFG